MKRFILTLAAIAALAIPAFAFAGTVDWTASTSTVSVGTDTINAGASATFGSTAQYIFHYRVHGTTPWTNSGVLVGTDAACSSHYPCSLGIGHTISGLGRHTTYDFQVGIKADGNELAWVGPDGTSATFSQATTS